MAIIQPLDFENILVDFFAGSYIIAYIILMIAIAYLSAKFRMDNKTVLLMLVLFVVMFAKWFPIFYLMLIAIFGLIGYYLLSKMIK